MKVRCLGLRSNPHKPIIFNEGPSLNDTVVSDGVCGDCFIYAKKTVEDLLSQLVVR